MGVAMKVFCDSVSCLYLLTLCFLLCTQVQASGLLTEEKVRERSRYSDLRQPADDGFPGQLWQVLVDSRESFNDAVIVPLSAQAKKYLDVFNHHVIDPVRCGEHYLRYGQSVMLGTFDNVSYESTGTTTWPYAIVGVPYGMVLKNTVADFKLGSEVRSPGISESLYHDHPVTETRLGAESVSVGNQMAHAHHNELMVIDVVRPFLPKIEWCDEEDSLAASVYRFYYAATRLVTDVNFVVDFEDTEYFRRTGRYEESDRTLLFQWNKGISRNSSFRSGQIIRVDRKGYFSMGSVPVAWNYCEVLLHEGGSKEVESVEDEEEVEVFFERPESFRWGMRSDKMLSRERIRTVRKKVVKHVPNVTTFRVYTENLCQAAEASVRSKSEVVVFATRRWFSWLVPSLVLLGAPTASWSVGHRYGFGHSYPLTFALAAGVVLSSWVFPVLWESSVADTIHTIRFPPPEEDIAWQ